MAKASELDHMRNRGLLTKADRAFFQGDREPEDPESRRGDIRYNINQRMDRIEEDLRILREAGEDDLVANFWDRFGRTSQLEKRVEELEQELEEARADDGTTEGKGK